MTPILIMMLVSLFWIACLCAIYFMLRYFGMSDTCESKNRKEKA